MYKHCAAVYLEGLGARDDDEDDREDGMETRMIRKRRAIVRRTLEGGEEAEGEEDDGTE